ncbi:MAG: hypothetical protein AB1449_15030 [Chloroflexota bacterium]
MRRITALGRIRGVFSKANLGVGLITSVLGNLYDYTLGEHRGERLGSDFFASTAVDFLANVGTGLAAAGVVAGGVALVGALGVTAPLVAVVAATAIAGAVISSLLDRSGILEQAKESVSQGFDAWGGIFHNVRTITSVLPAYVNEAVARPVAVAVRERVVQPVVQAAQQVSGAVRGAAQSVGQAVSGFFGRLFGGNG